MTVELEGGRLSRRLRKVQGSVGLNDGGGVML